MVAFKIRDDFQAIAQLNAFIFHNVAASMLFSFSMGVYTLVYIGTMYLYITRRSPKTHSRIVLISITILWACCLLIWALDLYLVYLQWHFFTNPNLDLHEFGAYFGSPLYPIWLYATASGMLNIMFVVSDGLLIWRCFHVWNRSWKIILCPLVLLVGETVLEIATAILKMTLPVPQLTTTTSSSKNPKATLTTTLGAAGLFASFLTTILTSSLIAYRVYSTYLPHHSSSSSKSSKSTTTTITEAPPRPISCKISRVVKVLLESAAIYSLIILTNAITNAIPATENLHSPTMFAIHAYLAAITAPVAGMAPTILVACIISVNPNSDVYSEERSRARRVGYLSDLRFQTMQMEGSSTINEGT